ncbi:T9SS type A sorting domain-containing protein [Chryseobacterium sp. SNU WT5]|uniref:M12 family metallo-peptidase n=1 Tax=Chryseobacterium sp. SNU WT5 TaxID=2594269 RepID=UPI00117CAC6F|nr:M12 family metallo-peptidase [Chryseobacterium sp. SNU WT5]QDP86030.1 T9SS type A sorting domain-containing protein [Chryseobacterium sp. SNU WT5]
MKKLNQFLAALAFVFTMLFTTQVSAQTFVVKGIKVAHVDGSATGKNNFGEIKSVSNTFKKYDVFKLNIKDLATHVKGASGTTIINFALGEAYQWKMNIEHVDLYSPNAKGYELTENGQKEVALPRNILFKGTVNGNKADEARLTIADNTIAGMLMIGDEKYYIESLKNIEKSGDVENYVIYKASDVVERPDLFCQATKDTRGAADVNNDLETGKAGSCNGQWVNKIATYATYKRFNSAGGTTQVNTEILTILNNVQAFYNEYNLKLVVTEQKVATCSTCNPWGDRDNNINSLLDGFTSWGPTGFTSTHDQGICFFDGSGSGAVGLAWVGTICTNNRYNVCDKLGSSSQNRVLVAHEMGHNFGANHDAAGSNYIMAPSVSAATTWSSSSKNAISGHIASRSCLSCDAGTTPTECNIPTGLAVENLTATAVTLNWNDISGATGYTLQFRATGSSTWQSFDTTASVLDLSGLTTGITYQWQVKTKCSSSSSSAYAGGSDFTSETDTPPDTCAAPASASASNITTSSATINWSSAEAPNYYIYVLPSGGNWYLAASELTGTSYNLTGLTANKSYTIEVYSNCSNGAVAKRFTFTTSSNPSSCGSPINPSIVTQYGDYAKLAWGGVSGAGTYTTQIKPSYSSSWYIYTYPNTSIAFQGLQYGVTYQWRVRSNCSKGSSDYVYGPNINGYARGYMELTVAKEEKLTIYPNPSKSNFTLRVENSSSQFGDMEVIDISGKVVYSASTVDLSLPLVFGDQLVAGIYIVRVITAQKTTVSKVIKL